ncbi:zinc ABC transporter ATP-binding protein AztA [Allonocardiopsis opalescens]|uniref:Zinc/manganese transport system ATP-binding protein n=1 Tax=Allonocardiopsis opalescens TaxID=1144618 RepID=A0A2T0QF12_9ACTN|nr:zinc ABC transporter ATP-binding protein AztA [Allonocardiopsis opalescens]PRY02509.1 zinc/manganese transport system ATP-binding protein [Allonocardiopsis opalescens]
MKGLRSAGGAEPERPADAVAFHGLSAGYPGRLALRGVTAAFPRGRTTAVLGPNGSGKSTLLGVAAGAIVPLSGSVARAGSTRPAFVVQRSAVADALPITVEETVAMGRWAHRRPWQRLTARDRAVVAECLARMGLEGLADRRLGDLSGGQRQRALVAQGLAQESDLLLLDEPTAGLDLDAQDRISTTLAEACERGTTVVHATHDLADAARADHCLILKDGRVLAQGPPATALTGDTVRESWGLTGLL